MEQLNDKKEKNQVVREFYLTSWALKNTNTVFLMIFLLAGFGYYAYRSMPKELFPDIVIPTVMVQTLYPGNPPVDIENLITRELEKEIESVTGIKTLTSLSSQDASNIFVEFNTDVDIKTALQDVKDAVDKAKKNLPDNLTNDPMISDIDFSEFPIINVNLSGNYSINELKTFAEFLKDEIETFSEISKVEITGITEREVKIMVDQYKMDALKISFSDIDGAIRNENISMSGGELKTGGIRRAVRIVGEFASISEIENVIVKHEDQHIVYLKDVAEVVFAFEDPTSFARLNHQPVVSLQVVKKGGENLLDATDKIFNLLDVARKDQSIPDDLKITITNDQSEQIKLQLSNLENSIIMGFIFVVLILFFFLGARNALFVGISIPLSMFISFMILGLMGIKINMIVLFSMILALGMLVDNAIVVVENIYRFVDKGYSIGKACRLAVGEIAIPIISSTATTLAAFFPLVFWDSLMGEFMKFLPITLIIVLTSSLLTALVLIPVVMRQFFKTENPSDRPNAKRTFIITSVMFVIAALFFISGNNTPGSLLVIFALLGLANVAFLNRMARWFQSVFLVWLENVYVTTLNLTLKGKNALWVVLGTVFMMVITTGVYFASNPKVELFPSGEPKYINILAELPLGSDITVTDSITGVIENRVYELLEPNQHIVKSVLTNIGKGAVGQNEGFTGRGGMPNKGLITVTFLDFKDRGGISTAQILKQLSEELVGKYAGVMLTVEKQNEGPPVGKPINIEISGRDFDKLTHITDTLMTIIDNAGIAGIEGLQIDLDRGKPEYNISIDRNMARRFGLSTNQIANTIRTSLFGSEISTYKLGEDDYPIKVRMNDSQRYNMASLLNQSITFRDQASGKIVKIPMSSVASASISSTYGAVSRIDRNRVITISSNVIEGYNANEINVALKPILASFDFPNGYRYKFTGQQEEQQESMAFLINALLIAIAIILLILVTQFNSIIKPIIILSTVVLSTIGVFGGLATFSMDFVVIMTGIGIVSLAGVVVNNGIVLIDFISLLKLNKKIELGIEPNGDLNEMDSVACIKEAGKTRLRPVLLTAITTVLGLLPLAVGLNFDFLGLFENFKPDIYFGGDNALFWGSMSWTVIFGLTFATFLTLIVVPAMYHVFYLTRYRFKKRFMKVS